MKKIFLNLLEIILFMVVFVINQWIILPTVSVNMLLFWLSIGGFAIVGAIYELTTSDFLAFAIGFALPALAVATILISIGILTAKFLKRTNVFILAIFTIPITMRMVKRIYETNPYDERAFFAPDNMQQATLLVLSNILFVFGMIIYRYNLLEKLKAIKKNNFKNKKLEQNKNDGEKL